MTTINPTAETLAQDDHAHGHEHHELTFVQKYIFSEDHKIIGIQFLFTTLFMLMVGGALALGVRWQLAYPFSSMPIVGKLLFPGTGGTISPEFYTMLVTMHASVMIFLVIIPVLAGAFGNFLIPLQIGADDMAFPKLNMMSYWFMWPAIICFGLSWINGLNAGPAAGWTSYPALSAIRSAAPGSGSAQTWWLMGLTCVGVSSMMGSVNYMTTIINMRAPGMTLFRMPLTIWAMFITAILQAFALPVLTAAGFMLLFDRMEFGGMLEGIHSCFFVPAGLVVNNAAPTVGGGQPLLWQHLFWFYSHPAVYIMLLPAMGMVSDILACMSRKPVFGYKPMVYSMAAIAGLGFIVWGHHMFTSGMNPALGMTFMTSTIMIALPSAIKTFNWIGTIWGGKVRFNTPMLNCIAFVAMFVVGGLSGIFMAAVPVDIYFHDTYFIVAHFHYVLFGATLFGVFGSIHFWYPKMFGRMMNDKVGKLHFLLTFIGFNGTFFPMHMLGIAGMPRRYADPYMHPYLNHLLDLNQFMTGCAILMGFAQFLLIGNFLLSIKFGEKAGRNPWGANGLEWTAPSPPGHGNFDIAPVCYRGPYEYSSPLVDDRDFLMQTDYLPPTDTKAESSTIA